MPARMSCSMSEPRRSADFRSANPVDTTNRCPLIIFLKYQSSPRFIKPITHPLCHPAIQRETIESNAASLLDERDLTPANLVVERVHAHTQIARRSVDVEPSRLKWSSGFSRFKLHDRAPQNFRAVVMVRCGKEADHRARL